MKNRIKETRVAKGMTQGELANKSGLTRPYISKLENNEESVIKNTTMNSIANALGNHDLQAPFLSSTNIF